MQKQDKSKELLIAGINNLILKNRCSLSDSEIKLLKECLKTLKKSQKTQFKKNVLNTREGINQEFILKLVEMLLRIFGSDIADFLKDIF